MVNGKRQQPRDNMVLVMKDDEKTHSCSDDRDGVSLPVGMNNATDIVLVVDDDPQVIRVLLRIMSACYQVETAMTIAEALENARGRPPAFILLDVHLSYPPVADGLSCLTALRKAGYDGPIFMLSADTAFELVHKAARLGANGFLAKCDPERFLERLTKLLKQSLEAECRPTSLTPPATAYLETRGFNQNDLELLGVLSRGFEQESDIARVLDREEQVIIEQLQTIRSRLGARSQGDLARILGVLSCFTPL